MPACWLGEVGEGIAWSAAKIASATPSRSVRTSLFHTRNTRKSLSANHLSRQTSRALSLCWPPSASIIRRARKHTKSTMKGPIGTCRLNLCPSKRCARSKVHNFRSASVGLLRIPLANSRSRPSRLSPWGRGRRREATPGEGRMLVPPSPTPTRPCGQVSVSSPARGEEEARFSFTPPTPTDFPPTP